MFFTSSEGRSLRPLWHSFFFLQKVNLPQQQETKHLTSDRHRPKGIERRPADRKLLKQNRSTQISHFHTTTTPQVLGLIQSYTKAAFEVGRALALHCFQTRLTLRGRQGRSDPLILPWPVRNVNFSRKHANRMSPRLLEFISIAMYENNIPQLLIFARDNRIRRCCDRHGSVGKRLNRSSDKKCDAENVWHHQCCRSYLEKVIWYRLLVTP